MPEIGEKIYHYTIISAIGSGGMGKVFLAEDTKLDRRTALKFLAPELVPDREHHERFIREARASSALNHPNICTIYEINDDVNQPFIAMEYIEGETVASMIRRRRRNVRQSMAIASQIAQALSEAHSKGVVHRDIKPANIIVTGRGVVKILDFGLAKRITSEDAAAVPQFQTNAGVVLGTASYMPPEQARGLDVDNRADIWSLGVCLYEMLTGRLPFAGDTVADTFAAILKGEPEPPSRLVAGIPVELDNLVMRCIERPREKRFQSVEELITELEMVRDNVGLGEAELPDRPDEPTELFHSAPADLLEEMSPDDAVDVLDEMDDEKAQELFDLMEDDEKADVAELMAFEHDTAGGLMTTEFIVFPKVLTVGETIARLREMAETPNMIYYLYVVEKEDSWKIRGLISLRSLILADPTHRLEDVMRSDFRYAHPSESASDVAQTIAEYNLLALPVVDDEGDIAGIVTVDDAMEILLPKNLQRRVPRVFG